VVFRADAAFAKLKIQEALQEHGVKYAICIPAIDSRERLLTRPVAEKSSAGAAAWGDGAKACRLAGGEGVDAGDGRSEIRRPGGEGGEVFVACTGKDGIYQFWNFPAGRPPRPPGAKTVPGGKNAIRKTKGWRFWFILNGTWKSKMEIPAEGKRLEEKVCFT